MNIFVGATVVVAMFLIVLKAVHLIRDTKAFAFFVYVYFHLAYFLDRCIGHFASFSNNENFYFSKTT